LLLKPKVKQFFIAVKEKRTNNYKRLKELKNMRAGAANFSFTCHVIVKLITVSKIFVTVV